MAFDHWVAGDELQALVDAAAAELTRPVGIDDARFRPVAYSAHRDGFDAVRAECILRRESPAAAVRWVQTHGLATAVEPRRLPASAELGMAARVCVPLRYMDMTVGFLWLIDEPDALSADEVAAATAVAKRAAALLHRIRLLERQHRRREQLLLQRLATGDEATSARAADELLAAGYLEEAAAYRVFALRAAGRPEDVRRAAVADALERLRRTLPPHRIVAGEAMEVGLAVMACTPGEDPRRPALALAELGHGIRPAVGVSGALGREELRIACRQAYDAAALDGIRAGTIVYWDELGAYATILEARSRDALAAVPAGIRRLLASRDGAALVETLETYLELGGDAPAAAAALGVHRSSLYGRLRRIEAIADADLHSGDDRLQLHLGLRLWRLGGAARQL
jgi:hypothetical protein